MRDSSALLLRVVMLSGCLLSQLGYTQEWSSEPSVADLKAQLNVQAGEIQDSHLASKNKRLSTRQPKLIPQAAPRSQRNGGRLSSPPMTTDM